MNTKKIALEEETILFRLLGNDGPRKEVVRKIFSEGLEPYVTLLDDFDLEIKKMATSDRIHQIDPRLFKNLEDLRDTRAEVLRELGRDEGRIEEARLVLLRQLKKKFPEEQRWEALVGQLGSLESLEPLLDQILDANEAGQMVALVEAAREEEPL